ncbi:MAG: DNA internalization-related competence protein ComEC/Rec2 [Gammaproteobacteria bacterium]|nr:MAG: DNA internalization-related competence protein ComEC/Rec2 [Gammaproteobacteria bacterium]
MLIYALNFGFGILLFSLKNTLQITVFEWMVIFGIILAILTGFRRYKTLSLNLGIFLLGFAWMGIISTQVLNTQVDKKYLNKPILVTGEIIGLPEKSKHNIKFLFKSKSPFSGQLKLSWYSRKKVLLPDLQVGDTWQLLLKMKHNNGYQNLGGFDYEKWLFYKQIDATGYVKNSSFNQLIAPNKTIYSIDKIRQNIRQTLSPILIKQEFSGVLNALIIGDRSLITDKQWALFKATNTTHLSVVSGLHIGLISGFIFLLVQFFWRRSMFLSLRIPAQIMGAYFGLLSAFLYALIAGFSIPTGRAFIMASVVFLSIILKRHHNVWQLYGVALLLVLIDNPMSIFSVGFWLSFYVVAVIIYGARQHQERSWAYRLVYMQLLISLSTLPLTIWFFSTGSIVSPIANLIAIPVFSFTIIPLSLIATLLAFSGLEYLATLVFSIANQALIYLASLLEQLQKFEFNQWHYTQTSMLDLALFIAGSLIAISPKGLRLRALSLPILGLLFLTPIQRIETNAFLLTTLDVGQGLANVVQTRNHILLFDTGAKYRSGFNLGNSVITPYLHAKHIQRLDKVIISHGDNDHIGGFDNIYKNFEIGEILTSVPKKIKAKVTVCQTGQKWEWDGVSFEILNPDKKMGFKNNNASCVLKISNGRYSALLTGDIEKKAEYYLAHSHKEKIKSTILISPHHGSQSSSTQVFLEAVSPELITISSGFQNRFRHPSKKVMNRYQYNNIKVLQTNCSGQIDVLLGDKMRISEYRKNFMRYYFRQCE